MNDCHIFNLISENTYVFIKNVIIEIYYKNKINVIIFIFVIKIKKFYTRNF